jgi:hypothetical protein
MITNLLGKAALKRLAKEIGSITSLAFAVLIATKTGPRKFDVVVGIVNAASPPPRVFVEYEPP